MNLAILDDERVDTVVQVLSFSEIQIYYKNIFWKGRNGGRFVLAAMCYWPNKDKQHESINPYIS